MIVICTGAALCLNSHCRARVPNPHSAAQYPVGHEFVCAYTGSGSYAKVKLVEYPPIDVKEEL